MPPAVRITEVPSEPRAERIQTGRRFTFFFKETFECDGIFFLCSIAILKTKNH